MNRGGKLSLGRSLLSAFGGILSEAGRSFYILIRFKALSPNDERSKFTIVGSAQEFVETRILSSFPQNDEFGLRDCHALSLEQQIAEILVTAASSKKGLDVAVDGFYHSEAYFGPAVVQDAV